MEHSKYQSWAFRGQASAEWPLYSSISRYLQSYNVHPDAWSEQESRILRIFKRKAHLLLTHLPDEDDSFQWLGLMQHHGAPTRLLDFTWSPYVAAFFALERATAEAALWAVSPSLLNTRRAKARSRAKPQAKPEEMAPWVRGGYETHFLPNVNRIVVAGEPHRMNERLVAQSGTFLMAGVLDEPIEALAPPEGIVKFVLDARVIRRSAMAELYRMNISNATLFPGLDGLARSLAYELETHWAFDPITMKKRPGFFTDEKNTSEGERNV
jgi:hypothetical protein